MVSSHSRLNLTGFTTWWVDGPRAKEGATSKRNCAPDQCLGERESQRGRTIRVAAGGSGDVSCTGEHHMTLDSVQPFLLRCLVINYGILLLWFLAFWFGHDWMFRLYSRWFQLSKERFDSIHYASMAG